MNILTLTSLIPYSMVAKNKERKKNQSYLLAKLLLVFFIMAFFSHVYAQSYSELEPNNTCNSAQNLTSVVLPLQVNGYKTQPYGDAVDYYQFSATSGAQVRVTLNGDFSNAVPLTAYGVGFFTSDCPISPSTSSFSISSPAQIDFTVPSNGIFIIGVTACCDTNFSGSGTIEGAYVLSIESITVESIKSISGRVKDRVTGRPLAGTIEPFAQIQLYRSSLYGFLYVAEIPTSETGDYIFSSATVGKALAPGDYRVVGYANQYQETNNAVDLVNVQADEARVAPVLTLLSNPVRITDVQPCDAIPAQGGNCDFSYKVTNGTANRMKGAAWSLVKAWGTGGFVNGTNFLACEHPLILIPGRDASQVMRCRFTVPARVPENAYFCLDARFGEGSLANPYFTVQGVIDPLFCLTKLPGQGNFQVLPQDAAVELMRHKWHKGDHR